MVLTKLCSDTTYWLRWFHIWRLWPIFLTVSASLSYVLHVCSSAKIDRIVAHIIKSWLFWAELIRFHLVALHFTQRSFFRLVSVNSGHKNWSTPQRSLFLKWSGNKTLIYCLKIVDYIWLVLAQIPCEIIENIPIKSIMSTLLHTVGIAWQVEPEGFAFEDCFSPRFEYVH